MRTTGRILAVSGLFAVVVTRIVLRRARTRSAGAETGGTSAATGEPGVGGAEPGAEQASAEVAAPREADSTEGRRAKNGAVRAMVLLLVLVVCAGVAIPFALTRKPRADSRVTARRSGDVRHSAKPSPAETVTSVLPAAGTTSVVPDTTIQVTFSEPLAPHSRGPSLTPAVAGTWRSVSPSEMLFTPTASFIPSTTYTVTVPGGQTGARSRGGSVLTQSVTSSFTVVPGSVLRLQQLLATLGYLPLEFSGTTPVPSQMALAQPGTFAWRDQGFPTQYTSQWSSTQFTAITRGAVMAFETQNGLAVDGNAGPSVWTALLADVAAGKRDAEPVTYVLVTKSLPQHLTVWVNGALTFSHVPCNTGVPGATTADGTFEVFSHVQVSNMRGTDVTGTSYDVTVPWASYFNGGDALHGYPRASYGFPQSNGCVEMPISTAGRVWPYTPIGTVVTVATD